MLASAHLLSLLPPRPALEGLDHQDALIGQCRIEHVRRLGNTCECTRPPPLRGASATWFPGPQLHDPGPQRTCQPPRHPLAADDDPPSMDAGWHRRLWCSKSRTRTLVGAAIPVWRWQFDGHQCAHVAGTAPMRPEGGRVAKAQRPCAVAEPQALCHAGSGAAPRRRDKERQQCFRGAAPLPADGTAGSRTRCTGGEC